ncbi:hypothetical protein LR48_Vigan01g033100 [Vigna angularis]|uniref:Uncharacterized protein n=1 Tax=Phaseolus angularis TaxID=3914 RepID=A0A0L9TJX4_PHAAN|nr:uncharacterized protein LOC108320305 [Vigna angularis]XP_017407188.1 uncharacterized protein LOC108320305 [Vigna angularis]KAG2410436.1 uncharacterized protein HKW66_Vig0011010 [Vigna angularis]KOM30776.1 hypothetical protein LR48_Vigan01g033100 [Vigna angularis]
MELPNVTIPKVGQKPPAKLKFPTPKELISHYESQGMDSQEASMKVIEDLQKALFGVVSSSKGRNDKLLAESSKKIDSISNRLIVLDLKLDSKPGYVETFAIGLASGAALKGIGALVPHILAPLAQILNSVSAATKSSPQ